MTQYPEFSKDTATYGGFIVGFELPVDLGWLTARGLNRAYDIDRSSLPPRLKEVIQALFTFGIVEEAKVNSRELSLTLVRTSPTGDQLTMYEAFDLFRQVLVYVSHMEIQAEQWEMLPSRQYERGSGFDTSAAGRAMAWLMGQFCTQQN